MCVWLGCLASYREGLVRRLLRDAGEVERLIGCTSAEIAALVTPREQPRPPASAGGRAGASRRAASERGDDDASDRRRFLDLLALGPERCLRRMESRPASDRVVAWCDPTYPDRLRHLADPPLCLFVRASCPPAVLSRRLEELASRPAVAVVGTRSPSAYGEEMARLLGRDLRRAGLVVVSGLALGIDAFGHAAALEGCREDVLCTVAVLGCGADVVYPRANTSLYAAVSSAGLLVSEFAWGVPARAWRFPARNRVMAALSRGVVLVEGAERSGARITAGFALELGREVLCVPGEAGRRLSAAPHQLIREGAQLCESATDVLRAIAVEPLETCGGAPPGARAGAVRPDVADLGPGVARDVLAALGASAATIDDLVRSCGAPAPQIAGALGELEIDGLVRRAEGGLYRVRRR